MVLTLLLTMVIGVYAEGSTVTNKVTFSEYDLVKNYFGKSSKQLLEMGVNKKQIKELTNLEDTIMKKVRELYLLDDKSLIDQGYSQQQIDAIRSINTKFLNDSKTRFSGLDIPSNSEILSSVEVRGLFGNVDMNVDANDFFSGDNIYVWFDWSWDGKPFVLHTDGIGFAWDGGFRASSNDIEAEINYVDGNNSGSKNISRSDMDIVAGAGWGFDIRMATGPAHTTPAWAKNGSGSFWLSNPDNEQSIQMVWKYGHSTYNITGACVDIKGTLSIGFSRGVEEMYEDERIWSW